MFCALITREHGFPLPASLILYRSNPEHSPKIAIVFSTAVQPTPEDPLEIHSTPSNLHPNYSVIRRCAASDVEMTTSWEDFVLTRDPSDRLYVAHCSLCGHLLAASPDRPITERLAASHQCELKLQARIEKPRQA
jgi:hypothetical protein